MDPRDVNRINYNNYYVGQNLDFLVRSKMRSESLSTPLKNTPSFYDDEVSSKMSLLGKRGFYDPGYIYGFMNKNDNKEINQNEQMSLPKEYDNKEKILYNYENNNNPKDYQKYLNEVNYNRSNNTINENIYRNDNNSKNNQYYNELLYKQKLEALKKAQTPQKLDDFQLDKVERNKENNFVEKEVNNIEQKKNQDLPKYEYEFNRNEEEGDRAFYDEIRRNNNGMVRNQDKIPNQDYYKQIREYNYINELSKKNVGEFSLPLTRNEILQGVLTGNNNKNQFSK